MYPTALSLPSSLPAALLRLLTNVPVELMNMLTRANALARMSQAFITGEVTDENKLTNLVFFTLNPGLTPKTRLNAAQQQQWKTLLTTLVQPYLRTPAVSLYPHLNNGQYKTFIEKLDNRNPIKPFGPLIGNKNRDLTKIDGIVLHQTADGRSGDPHHKQHLNLGAHFLVLYDGSVVRMFPNKYYLNAANCLNGRSVSIEFAGNFPHEQYRWWFNRKEGSKPKNVHYPSPAQVNAGRQLIKQLKQELPALKYIFAHRQSSQDRDNDPGPDLWFNVGEWARNHLGLNDVDAQGKASFSCGRNKGKSIPASWRVARGAAPLVAPPKPSTTPGAATPGRPLARPNGNPGAPATTGATCDVTKLKAGTWKMGGYSGGGGVPLTGKLLELRQRGLHALTDDQIDLLQRISNVESGGRTVSLNSYDSACMSFGFVQNVVVFRHRYEAIYPYYQNNASPAELQALQKAAPDAYAKYFSPRRADPGKLQMLIDLAAPAFQRYGIALHPTANYPKTGSHDATRAIQGTTRANELRSLEWAKRFYCAGFDDDILAAQARYGIFCCEMNLYKMRKAAGGLFLPFYRQSRLLRGLIQEAYNNKPAPTVKALKRVTLAFQGRGASVSQAEFEVAFKGFLRAEFSQYNRGKEGVEHIITRTAR